MAGLYIKRKRRSRTAKVRCRRRAVGLSTSTGAFLAAAMTSLAPAPAAQADILDLIIDPVTGPAATTGLTDLFAGVDPTAGLAGLDLSSLGLDSSSLGLGAADSALASASDPSLAGLFDTLVYQPTYTIGQAWITSSIGEFIDNTFINPIGQALFGQDLLGNGASGMNDGTVLEAAGGPGGLWFGDGGAGATGTSTDPNGGAGGSGGDPGGSRGGWARAGRPVSAAAGAPRVRGRQHGMSVTGPVGNGGSGAAPGLTPPPRAPPAGAAGTAAPRISGGAGGNGGQRRVGR